MKFEQISGSTNENEPEKAEDARLSEDEARKEASMLRAKMDVNPAWGTIRKEDPRYRGEFDEVEPTAEDYDKAFEAIEELKKAAEEEPVTMKVLYKLGRIAHKSALAVPIMLMAFGDLLPPSSGGNSSLREANEEFLSTKVFEDAAARLRKMQKEGKEWSESDAFFGTRMSRKPNSQEHKEAA